MLDFFVSWGEVSLFIYNENNKNRNVLCTCSYIRKPVLVSVTGNHDAFQGLGFADGYTYY
jgi:hypothetical protein